MDLPPVLTDQSLDGMLAAVADEPQAAGMDLRSRVFRQGWESTVLETPDWIVRFPRREDIDFATEISVLEHVRGRLPVRTPEVAWVGARTRCMVYPKIIGTSFTPAAWHTGSARDREALSDSLAELLIAWREAFSADDVERLGIRPMGGPPYLGQLSSTLAGFPSAVRPGIVALLNRYAELFDQELAAVGPVVLHGDFHLGNMVLAAPCGEVTGLWDFSCVATGALSWDLHFLAGALGHPHASSEPPGSGAHLELLAQVVRGLGRCSGRSRSAGETRDLAAVDLALSDLMLCAEWLGDHEPAEATRWRSWLGGLADNSR
ncbi:hypothetical protein BWI15_31150 [Kribbella sp. ALI-6-A]|uniref:phosphotransferase family protein n=1 Tax=Kribbella sp. ALI-6-A TaxID=1933817 RepID=UPI00097C48AD|nr:phosphotransferase [Kribbella sp. ALI-6-A]ONI67566.1 hypothetical protein BWI15_31150 [Kribbella sp. ALI-6-A]